MLTQRKLDKVNLPINWQTAAFDSEALYSTVIAQWFPNWNLAPMKLFYLPFILDVVRCRIAKAVNAKI